MFYSETQLFLNFLRILDRLEVGVFARAVKLDSYGTVPTSSRAEKSCFPISTTSSQPDLHLQNIILILILFTLTLAVFAKTLSLYCCIILTLAVFATQMQMSFLQQVVPITKILNF
jgi:hypothetical protein